MQKTFHFYLCFAATLVVLLAGCDQQDENKQVSSSMFSYTDGRLTPVITKLQQIEQKQPFEAYFRKWYGTPLWDYADINEIGGRTYYYVPVYDAKYPRNIHTIWFFLLDNHSLKQAIMFREDETIRKNEQEGEFDYLAFKVFGAENASRLIFEESEGTTRGWLSYSICRDAYVIVGPYKEYKGTTCKSYTVWIDEATPPGEDDDTNVRWPDGGDPPMRPDPDDGGGGGGGGGGDGDGGGPPLSKELTPIMKKNTNLSQVQLNLLKKALWKMNEDCYANAIYQHLVNNNIHFSSVQMNPSMFGDAGYGFKSRELYFRENDAINAESLFHEMFHLLQFSFGEGMSDYIGMLEYERTLFTDIMAYIRAERENNPPLFYHRRTNSVINGADIESEKSYKSWLHKITKGGKIYPKEISDKDFHAFSEIYQKYNRAYGHLNFPKTYVPTSFQKALKLVNEHCR
ncbi:hypothetical protein [Bacteroides heparinolyticus]|uniref:hypothetical protein n=1 Tax=Prevotella heparinolytica TaxID=28113 RepID=UPI0023F26A15|nr:hypothetical protein [Bacteroides heparinolyticus]